MNGYNSIEFYEIGGNMNVHGNDKDAMNANDNNVIDDSIDDEYD